jgi:hypothetical protein
MNDNYFLDKGFIKNGEEIPVSITGNAYIESRSIDAIQAKFRKFNFYIHL